MNALTVFVATDMEFQAVAGALRNFSRRRGEPKPSGTGVCGRTHVALFQTDMGPLNARRRVEQVLTAHPGDAPILCYGVSGGLSPDCKVGDVVICRECADERGAVVTCDAALFETFATRLAQEKATPHTGRSVTMARMLCRKDEKRRTFAERGAIAVDMESFSVVSAAGDFGRAAAVVRIVSDDAHAELPDMNVAFDADYRVRYAKMAAILASHPFASAQFFANLRRAFLGMQATLKAALKLECGAAPARREVKTQ